MLEGRALLASFQGLGFYLGDDFPPDNPILLSGDGTTVVTGATRWTAQTGAQTIGNSAIGAATSVSYNGSAITFGTTLQADLWTQKSGQLRPVPLIPPFHSLYVSADGATVTSLGSSGVSRWTTAGTTSLLMPATSSVGSVTYVGIDGGGLAGMSSDGSVFAGTIYKTFTDPPAIFRWNNGTLTTLSDGFNYAYDPTAVSPDGSVIIGLETRVSSTAAPQYQGFLWGPNGVTNFGPVLTQTPPAPNSPATQFFQPIAASNGAQTVVGYQQGFDSSPVAEATIWDATHGLRTLQAVLVSDGLGSALKGWQLTEAAAITADGNTIAGVGIDPQGKTEVWVAHLNAEPDIAMTSATIHGSQISFNYMVTGNPGSFVVGLYQSAKQTFDASATLIATQTILSAPNSSSTSSFTLNFTPVQSRPYLLVIADPFHLIPEQNWDNNSLNAVRDLAWGAKVSPEFRSKVVTIANELDTDPNYLMAAMAFETGDTFSSSIRNAASSGAVGLIQFIPATAKALGTTTQDLAAMTPVQQLDYVEQYLMPYRKRMTTLDDVYMAILYPAAIGKGSGYVLFAKANDTKKYHPYAQNIGLDLNHDGKITVAEAAYKVNGQLTSGESINNVFVMQSYYH